MKGFENLSLTTVIPSLNKHKIQTVSIHAVILSAKQSKDLYMKGFEDLSLTADISNDFKIYF
jgi:hypothetical protein